MYYCFLACLLGVGPIRTFTSGSVLELPVPQEAITTPWDVAMMIRTRVKNAMLIHLQVAQVGDVALIVS